MASKKSRRFDVIRRSLLVVLIFWVAIAFGRVYWKNYQTQQELIRLESEIRAYQIRSEQLEAEIARLQAPEFVEKVAREELGLVNPGERLYIISEELP